MDAGLLALDPKGLVSTPITGCGHKMAPWSEVTVDHSMGRREPLCLIGRFQALHLPLSSSCGPMRILSSVVEVLACPMPASDISARRARHRADPPHAIEVAKASVPTAKDLDAFHED